MLATRCWSASSAVEVFCKPEQILITKILTSRFIKLKLPIGKIFLVAVPLIWLMLFFIIPFGIAFEISFAEPKLAIPPYTDVLIWDDGWIPEINGTLWNYELLLDDDLYISAYLSSVKIASITTVLCLIFGFPSAYLIARAPRHWQVVFLFLVILPFWTSFLLRVYAWQGLLAGGGIINKVLLFVGIVDEPITMLQTNFAVYSGLLYTYIPFMILPIYAALARFDWTLVDAAEDLGAGRWDRFATITLPLSIHGIIAGSMLVFIPVIGEYIVPKLLGGGDTLMIGQVLWDEFFRNRDWTMAAAVSTVMLVLVVIPMVIFQLNFVKR